MQCQQKCVGNYFLPCVISSLFMHLNESVPLIIIQFFGGSIVNHCCQCSLFQPIRNCSNDLNDMGVVELITRSPSNYSKKYYALYTMQPLFNPRHVQYYHSLEKHLDNSTIFEYPESKTCITAIFFTF